MSGYLTADDVADRLDGVRRSSGGWIARCPVHEDRAPSLSVHDGKKGTVIHCHAGCPKAAIADALGFQLPQLFADYSANGNGGSDVDMVLREMVRKDRQGTYVPRTLGAVMGAAFTGPHEWWFDAYELHAEYMDTEFNEAYKMWNVVADTVVWTYLAKWWATLDPNKRNWHEVREAAMRKLATTYRERDRYARGY